MSNQKEFLAEFNAKKKLIEQEMSLLEYVAALLNREYEPYSCFDEEKGVWEINISELDILAYPSLRKMVDEKNRIKIRLCAIV